MPRAVPSAIWQIEGFARCLSLRDLASLSCAQKDWQAPVLSIYSSSLARQLVQALAASSSDLNRALADKQLAPRCISASRHRQLRQLWSLVSTLQASYGSIWGPAIAAAPGLLQDITQIFTVPRLPRDVMVHFVKIMDLRVSYQQLMAAAHKQVKGVDGWVLVQRSLETPIELPEIVVSVCCCDKDLHLDQLQSQTLQEQEDILQLALNGDCPTTAASVAAQVAHRLTNPAKLLHLLHTAVAREHHKALQSAVASPAAAQLTASAVLQLIQGTRTASFDGAGRLMHWLVQLPAAATLATAHVAPLMQRAVASQCDIMMKAVCSLPAAHDTPHDDMISMLQQVVGRAPLMVRALCSLAAAARLTAEDVMPLMSKAMTVASYEDIRVLCTLPAAKHLPVTFFNTALQWAVTHNCDETVAALCSLQAASPGDYMSLMKEALQKQHLRTFKALCQLPAVQQVVSGSLPELVRLVARNVPRQHSGHRVYSHRELERITEAFRLLVSLDSVQNISAADFLKLLKYLVQISCSSEDILSIWFGCIVAHSMPVDTLAQQMEVAIALEDDALLRALCEIPAASQICDVHTLLQLINQAIEAKHSSTSMHMLQSLCKLPAAFQLNGKQLADVLSAMVEKDVALVLELCQLPAATSLPVATVADLLQTAVQQENRTTVKMLCKMQVSSYLSSDLVEQLLLAAVGMNDYETVTVVCALSGAAQISNISILLDKMLGQSDFNPDGVEQLCQLPAARHLTADALMNSLDKAVKTNSGAAVRSLCGLPGADSITQQGVLQLMQTAVQTANTNGILSLCQLKAAHQIPAEALMKLLRTLKVLKTLAPQQEQEDAMMAFKQLLERVQQVGKISSKRG